MIPGATTGLGANPATSWPKGKPAYTTEYPEELREQLANTDETSRKLYG